MDKRDSFSPAGEDVETNGIECGGEGWGEGVAFRSDPLIRPSGTFSPTVEFCPVFQHRLWGRRVAVSGALDAVLVSV
jgi:hypothetical protein